MSIKNKMFTTHTDVKSCFLAPSASTNRKYHCARQAGYCNHYKNKDQRSGQVKLYDTDVKTTAEQKRCLEACFKYRGAIACEGIAGQSNRCVHNYKLL